MTDEMIIWIQVNVFSITRIIDGGWIIRRGDAAGPTGQVHIVADTLPAGLEKIINQEKEGNEQRLLPEG